MRCTAIETVVIADMNTRASSFSIQQQYQAAVAAGVLQADAAQAAAVDQLESVAHYIQQSLCQQRGITGRLMRRIRAHLRAPKGVYLYGDVGRGKTMLMNWLAEALGPGRVLRLHFHEFMSKVHKSVRRDHASSATLHRVLLSLLGERRLFCLDEFIVTEIGDAMILRALLAAMEREKIVLVTTSNIAPDELYANGFNRQNFLPALDVLARLTETIHLQGEKDFRVQSSARDQRVYQVAQDADHDQRMAVLFQELSGVDQLEKGEVAAVHRHIEYQAATRHLAWFTFHELCEKPRSTDDYQVLSTRFRTMLVSAVPQLDDHRLDACYRFINLVDDLYEKQVRLLLTADVPLQMLYQGDKLAFEFRRLISRLTEMQSLRYQALAEAASNG